jgi:hypothetical protein
VDGWDARWLAGILAEQFDFERRGRETAAWEERFWSWVWVWVWVLMKRERRRGGMEEMGNLREKEREMGVNSKTTQYSITVVIEWCLM